MRKANTLKTIACLGALVCGTILAGDVTTTGGTTNTIPVFTGSSAIGNSILAQSGSEVTVTGTLNVTESIQIGGLAALYEKFPGNIVALGSAVTSLTTGVNDTGLGWSTLLSTTTGSENTAVGAFAMYENTTGSANTAVGDDAMSAGSGSYNTAVGMESLSAATSSGNTVLGYYAGSAIAAGNYNIDIGYSVSGASADTGVIRIGNSNQTSTYLAGVYGVTPGTTGVEVYIDSAGQLGTKSSSIRYKEEVQDMDGASDGLFRLRPVTFRYKQPLADGSKPLDYGLIAEEVADVYPEMVSRNAEGQIETVQYSKLTPMLLNEVQKQRQEMDEQHRLLEGQAETIRLLERRLAAIESASHSSK